jgi:hypothetical protein
MTIKLNKKRQTNVEFITELMEFSNHGAMAQLFIMDALKKVANHVASIPLEELRKEFDGSMVSADAWHGVAKEISQKFDGYYAPSNN